MKRFISFLIVLGAIGYLGYTYRDQIQAQIAKFNSSGPATADDSTPPGATPAPGAPNVPGSANVPGSTNNATPRPAGEKFAPPGVFYVIERVSVETATGIKALEFGEEVRLLARKGGGVLQVTSGGATFDVKETQVTNDLDIAAAAKRKAPPPMPR